MSMSGGKSYLLKSAYPNYGNYTAGMISLYLYVKEVSQSSENNQTVLSLGMYVTTPSSSYDIGSWSDYGGSYIGTATSGEFCKSFDGGIPNFAGTHWIVENQYFTITHNSDGTKTVKLYWKWGVNSAWGGFQNSNGSKSVALTPIDRESTISSITPSVSVDGTNAVALSVNRASKTFYHKVVFSIGSYSYASAAFATKTSYVIPVDWKRAITSATSGKVSVTLKTYSNSACTTQIGNSVSDDFKINVLPTDIPTMDDPTLEIINSLSTISNWGIAVYGLSKFKISINNAAGIYGSAINHYLVNNVVEAMPYTTDYATNVSSFNVVAVDSRGMKSAVHTVSAALYSYILPKLTDISVKRCTSDGTLNDDGTYVRVYAVSDFSPCNGKNSCVINCYYKTVGGSYGNAVPIISGVASIIGDGLIAESQSYMVKLECIDAVGNDFIREIVVPTSNVAFNIRAGGKGAGFGCYAETDNELTVDWNLNLKGALKYLDITSSITPIGPYLSGTDQSLRFYPCMELVLIRAKFDVVSPIPAGESTVVCSVTNNFPIVLNALSANCNSSSAVHPQAYINNVGQIKIKTNETIPAGSNLYINGFWFSQITEVS